jgi:hypothetical protein
LVKVRTALVRLYMVGAVVVVLVAKVAVQLLPAERMEVVLHKAEVVPLILLSVEVARFELFGPVTSVYSHQLM